MIISGVRNASIFMQDYQFFSAVAKEYLKFMFEITETDGAVGDILLETNPYQYVRQKNRNNFLVDAYLGFEKPTSPPYSNLFVIDSLLLVKRYSYTATGRKKCYFSRSKDYPLFKDGDVILYPQDPLLDLEVKAFLERFGHRLLVYTDSPVKYLEECGEIVPTNPYAKSILNYLGFGNYTGRYEINMIVKMLYNQAEIFS